MVISARLDLVESKLNMAGIDSTNIATSPPPKKKTWGPLRPLYVVTLTSPQSNLVQI